METMMDTHLLFSFSTPKSGGTTKLYVGTDSIAVEELGVDKFVDLFTGRNDFEYSASVDVAGARKILETTGLEPGDTPTKTLGRWFVARFRGDRLATTHFVALAKSAGVKPNIFAW